MRLQPKKLKSIEELQQERKALAARKEERRAIAEQRWRVKQLIKMRTGGANV